MQERPSGAALAHFNEKKMADAKPVTPERIIRALDSVAGDTSAQRPDWEKARAMALKNLEEITPEEDAQITADALADPDAQPMDDLISRGKPGAGRRSNYPENAFPPKKRTP